MKKQTKSDIAGLGLQVHPSSIGMFLRCPYQWYLVYIEGMRRAPAAALAVGSGVHAGLEYNFRQKIKTKKDCKLDEALDAFDMSFKEQIKGIDWNKEDISQEKANKQGIACVTHYHEVHAPLIIPKLVEFSFQTTIDGVPVKSTLDLLDIEDTLIDHKTANQDKGLKADNALQTCVYKLGAQKVDKKLKVRKMRIDYIIKTVTPRVASYEVPIHLEATTRAVLAAIMKSVKTGNFYPNPTGWWCSVKWCGFHREVGGPCKLGI